MYRLPLYEEIAYADSATVFSQMAHLPWAIFLDSVNETTTFSNTTSRYSYIACSPFKTVQLKNGISEQQIGITEPFDQLKELALFQQEKNAHLPPFQGGIAGYFSYDLCHYLEPIPYPLQDDLQFPDLMVGFYDVIISFDHVLKKAWIVSTGFPEQTQDRQQRRAEQRLKGMKNRLSSSVKLEQHTTSKATMTIISNFTEVAYKKAVKRAQQYILAGDVFEVNLAQRFQTEIPLPMDSYLLYKTLRTINPAPFSAYLNLGNKKILSASPEKFLSLIGREVETRPIKGTIRRGHSIAEEILLKNMLLQSTKDQAENIMIVDLMRNDLSRVCEDHSVDVETLCGLETYATVHHLVSVIKATLRSGEDAISLLKATIPGGSVTGAPKVRAMQIIAELEPHRRGPYCGNIGFISFTGDMNLSIAIRTFVMTKELLTYHAGGAVVLDSCAEQEYQETLDKAAALTATVKKLYHSTVSTIW